MKKTALVLYLALVAIGNANAFHINPINRDTAASPDNKKFLDHISEPVHERITRQAREIYQESCLKESLADAKCDSTQSHNRTIQDSLIRGVWWNDDPNQDLYKGRQSIWLTHMLDAERRARNAKYKIDDKYMMQYRSHYGDLQFLHSMASSDGEQADVTKKNIYMWGKLAYLVAIGNINENAKFREIAIDDLSNYFKRQSDWPIKWILQPRYHLEDTPNDFAEHALGTLLHMIEDSYSAAHVERDYTSSEQCPSGRIKSFHSYIHQNSTEHSKADTWQGYTETKYPEGAGPVDVAAKIIWFARHGSDWENEVMPYLEKTVYCFEGNPDPAGPGKYANR